MQVVDLKHIINNKWPYPIFLLYSYLLTISIGTVLPETDLLVLKHPSLLDLVLTNEIDMINDITYLPPLGNSKSL